MTRTLVAAIVAASAILAATASKAQNAYITNSADNSVSVIATSTNALTASFSVSGLSSPFAAAVTPDGSKVYIANNFGGVSVIATANNALITVVSTSDGSSPQGAAASPDNAKIYISTDSGTVQVIATASNTVTATIKVGSTPQGLEVTPDGSKVYVANRDSNNVSVIATSSNSVVATVPVGAHPTSFGHFIVPPGPSPLLAAVLPASRSVQVGRTATAFATIINSGTMTAKSCSIAASLPVGFVYQTTNPATNAVNGSPNTPVDIAASGSQSFVIALTPNAPISPTNVSFNFACTNASAAPSVTGLDTLLLSAAASQPPDIVALAATIKNDGIVHVTSGTPPSGAFAVATVNLGANSSITVSANTGNAALPVQITICQTNQQTGQCLQTPSAIVTTTIAGNATPTFGIFVTASAAVPFDPANSRIFVLFTDGSNAVRGETGVALTTQ
jgi:YVTN family beta-propeller protein